MFFKLDVKSLQMLPMATKTDLGFIYYCDKVHRYDYVMLIKSRDMTRKQKVCHNKLISVTNSYLVLWEFSTSQKELLLVSSRSISCLISGGDSSDSWMLVHALGLL